MRRAFTATLFIGLFVGMIAAGALVKGSVLAQSIPPETRALDVSYRYLSVGWIDWVTVQLSEAAESAQNTDDLVEALLILALTYESSENVEAARETYSRLIHTSGLSTADHALAYALLGRLELGQQRPLEAKSMLLEADRLLPNQASVEYGLGQVAEFEGDLTEAVRHYSRALEISQEWLSPILRSAAIHIRQEEPFQAASILSEARYLGTRDAQFHILLGESLEGIRAAYTASPESFVIDEELAQRLEIDLETVETSLAALIQHAADRALQLEPGNPRALQLLERL